MNFEIGFIGLGTMGLPMAQRLVAAGYALSVYNRSPGKAEQVKGAAVAASPAAAALGKDIVFTNVSDSADVEAVVLGQDGAAQTMKEGSVLIDLSTISADVTRKVAAALAARGVEMLDCPVSGGSEGAKKGTLAMMVGGKREVLARVSEVLAHLGSSLTYIGPSGSGQLTKAINQVVLAGVYQGVAEGVSLGLKAGLDMDRVVAAIAGGAAASWVLDNRSDNMIRNTYPLGFRTSLHHKDLTIALASAQKLGVSLPVAALVAEFESALIARGFSDEDMSNLARLTREGAGLEG